MEFKFAISAMSNTQRQNRLEVEKRIQMEPKTILTNQRTKGGYGKKIIF